MTFYEQLQERCRLFHAFNLGDKAALHYDTAVNPYIGHDVDMAHHWNLGFTGHPFPAREVQHA